MIVTSMMCGDEEVAIDFLGIQNAQFLHWNEQENRSKRIVSVRVKEVDEEADFFGIQIAQLPRRDSERENRSKHSTSVRVKGVEGVVPECFLTSMHPHNQRSVADTSYILQLTIGSWGTNTV